MKERELSRFFLKKREFRLSLSFVIYFFILYIIIYRVKENFYFILMCEETGKIYIYKSFLFSLDQKFSYDYSIIAFINLFFAPKTSSIFSIRSINFMANTSCSLLGSPAQNTTLVVTEFTVLGTLKSSDKKILLSVLKILLSSPYLQS